jgi:hypothetical protein
LSICFFVPLLSSSRQPSLLSSGLRCCHFPGLLQGWEAFYLEVGEMLSVGPIVAMILLD